MACPGGACGKDLGPLRDDEGPSPADLQQFGDVTRTCPSCRKDIFDDAEVCYHCGHALEGTAAGSSGTPLWVMVTAGAVLAGMVVLLVWG